jgi:NAD(P)-dependent dehydrogenase (short-subunit alcohol dehydrogenase family)
MDITGKVAVVTGSGQGLGLAYASALAASGAAVVVNDVDDERAGAAAAQIREAGGEATPVGIPVGDAESAEALVSTAVDTYGRLDVMVTNAGILRDRTLWNMSDEDFDDVIRVHLRGTFTCARAAAIQFREAGTGVGSSLPDPRRATRQLRPDQLRRGQGRDRRHGPDLGDGTGPRRGDSQRHHSQCRHRHDRNRSVPGAICRDGGEGGADPQ